MSLHSSLHQTKGKSGTLRNVLKRHERLRHLMSRGLWTDDRSIFGLPKIKAEKIKARKVAAKEPAADASAAATPKTPAAP